MTEKNETEAQINEDGWVNQLTNLGSSNSRSSNTRYRFYHGLPQRELEEMYRGSGLARRVVDIIVEDGLREWVQADPELIKELKRVKAKHTIIEAAKWGRLYGGAAIVALIDDNGTFDMPVNMSQIKSVKQLRIFSRHKIYWTMDDIDTNFESATYGEPFRYRINTDFGGSYPIHRSRLAFLEGANLPPEERQRNHGWADSVLETVYNSLKNFGDSQNASGEIVQDFVQTIIGISGLSEVVGSGNDDLIKKRAEIIDMSRSVANSVFIDSDSETYTKQASSVAGLSDLWDRFALQVSSDTGIPATKLLGRSPAGMNSTGEGDINNWYDTVHAYRVDEIEPVMNWLIELLAAQKDWKASERPESYEITWPALQRMNEIDAATVKKTLAETDAMYIDRGAVDPEFVYQKRFGEGEYNPHLTFSEDEQLEFMAERDKKMQQTPEQLEKNEQDNG